MRAPGRQKKRKEKEPKTLSAELARLTPDTRQQAVGRAVATVTAMAVQRASYAVCEGVFVRESAVCGALVGTLSNKKEFPTTTSSSEVADHREGVFLQD